MENGHCQNLVVLVRIELMALSKLKIVFEDKQILVVDKPPGLVVNRSQTIKEETLQDQLAVYFGLGTSLGIGGRAGIVHRLDREASGLLVVAKTQQAFERLQGQFQTREVVKEYVGLVHGLLQLDRGVVDRAIGRVGRFGKFGIVGGGRVSETAFTVEDRFQFKESKVTQLFERLAKAGKISKSRINYYKRHANFYTKLKIYPKTGRTHQIRVHLKSIGHFLVSDTIYAPSKLLKLDLTWCPRLFLNASFLEFKHPATARIQSFRSRLPNDLKSAIVNLQSKNQL